MESLKEIELSLNELGKIGEIGGVAKFRQREAVIVTTNLFQFNSHVINLFAPRGKIFWNFDCYPKLYFSEHAYTEQFLVPEKIATTDATLTDIIRQAGHKKKSNFSRHLMGSWTQRETFDPVDGASDWRYCAHRQFSILVPNQELIRVLEHFRLQLAVFADDSFAPCSEAATPVEFDDLRSTKNWKLFYENIVRMSAEERTWLYEEVKRFGTNQDVSMLAANLDHRFALKGLFTLLGIKSSFVPFVDMNCYAEVLRFRLKVALAASRYPALVFSEYDLKNITAGVYPDGLLEEILEALSTRLNPRRSIFDFELSSCKSE